MTRSHRLWSIEHDVPRCPHTGPHTPEYSANFRFCEECFRAALARGLTPAEGALLNARAEAQGKGLTRWPTAPRPKPLPDFEATPSDDTVRAAFAKLPLIDDRDSTKSRCEKVRGLAFKHGWRTVATTGGCLLAARDASVTKGDPYFAGVHGHEILRPVGQLTPAVWRAYNRVRLATIDRRLNPCVTWEWWQDGELWLSAIGPAGESRDPGSVEARESIPGVAMGRLKTILSDEYLWTIRGGTWTFHGREGSDDSLSPVWIEGPRLGLFAAAMRV